MMGQEYSIFINYAFWDNWKQLLFDLEYLIHSGKSETLDPFIWGRCIIPPPYLRHHSPIMPESLKYDPLFPEAIGYPTPIRSKEHIYGDSIVELEMPNCIVLQLFGSFRNSGAPYL